jgi:hypothetical protein
MVPNQKNERPVLRLGMWSCGILAAISLGFGIWEWVIGRKDVTDFHDLVQLGNYGSYLQGTVASLWALAGVFLIVLAFLGQQQQLREQQKQFESEALARAAELSAREEELADAREQFRLQQTSIQKQQFENTFFNC